MSPEKRHRKDRAKEKIRAKARVKVNVIIVVNLDTWRVIANNPGYSKVIVTTAAATATQRHHAQRLKGQEKVARAKELMR